MTIIQSSYMNENIAYAKSGNVCQIRLDNILSADYSVDEALASGLPRPKYGFLGVVLCGNSPKLLRLNTNGILQIPESINSGTLISGTLTYITVD